MATKKKRRGGRPKASSGPNKSDFIRQHPNVAASELVAKAKENQLSISRALVYAVRGRANPKRSAKSNTKPGPRSTNGRMTASDFIRSQPSSMKAKDVVDAATKAGVKKFGTNLVYLVRSKAKAPGVSRGRGRKFNAPVTTVSGGDISAFKRMALGLGIATARQALDELERGLAALLE